MRLFGKVGGTRAQLRGAYQTPIFDLPLLIPTTSTPFYRPGVTESADVLFKSTETADTLYASTESADSLPGAVDDQVQ